MRFQSWWFFWSSTTICLILPGTLSAKLVLTWANQALLTPQARLSGSSGLPVQVKLPTLGKQYSAKVCSFQKISSAIAFRKLRRIKYLNLLRSLYLQKSISIELPYQGPVPADSMNRPRPITPEPSWPRRSDDRPPTWLEWNPVKMCDHWESSKLSNKEENKRLCHDFSFQWSWILGDDSSLMTKFYPLRRD